MLEAKPDSLPAEADSEDRSGSTVQSVERAMALLRAVSVANGPDATTAALASACGLNRATAWRLLNTLAHEGMVTTDRSTGRWSLGMGTIELYMETGLDVLVRAAHARLGQLAATTGETAAIAMWRSGKLSYLDEATSGRVVSARWAGRTVPLHATSTGKAFLAWAGYAEQERYLRIPMERFTASTITDPDQLRAELAATRERGYGTCAGEFEESAYGVSAPLLSPAGWPVAVISIWGPGERLTPDRFEAVGQAVLTVASELGALNLPGN